MTEEASTMVWSEKLRVSAAAFRPAVIALATVVVMFSLARGLRFPSFWAASAAQVDCSAGFVKRCALGEVAHLLHYPVSNYFALAALSCAALACALCALAWNSRAMFASRTGRFVALAFASSFAAAYYVDLIGYYDIPLTIVALGAVWCAERGRIWSLAALTVVGLLIHELYLLTFLPVTLAPLLLGQRLRWRALLGIGALAVGITILMALQRPATPEFADALYRKANATANFPIRRDYFYVFRWSLKSNLRLMQMLAYPEQYWRDMVVWGAWMVLPVMAIVGWLIARGWSQVLAWKRVAIAAAILTPLSLNLIGLDASRWYDLVAVNAFIVLGLLFRLEGPPSVEARPLVIATLAASCLGLCTQVRFIDDMPPSVIEAVNFRLPIWEPPMPKAEARALFKRSKVIDLNINSEQP